MKLLRSYRSTWEITAFAQHISYNPNQIAMERHGEPPAVKHFDSNMEEIADIRNHVLHFKSSGYQLLGILCKTSQQAEFIYGELKSSGVHLVTADSTSFKEGVVITTVHLAKGLEFDEVIIPFVSDPNYQSDMDKSILYIACTRAMHRLTLTYSKEKTRFIR